MIASLTLRPALPADLDALEAIETAVFDGDRLSRRSLRRFITAGTAAMIVAQRGGDPDGYALVGFRWGSRAGRLYSIAVLPRAARGGIGRSLLGAAEAATYARGCDVLRLEVRADNAAAIRLYEAEGYRRFGEYEDYYEDGASAFRYEKRLAGPR